MNEIIPVRGVVNMIDGMTGTENTDGHEEVRIDGTTGTSQQPVPNTGVNATIDGTIGALQQPVPNTGVNATHERPSVSSNISNLDEQIMVANKS